MANNDRFLNQLIRTYRVRGFEHLSEYAEGVRFQPWVDQDGEKRYWRRTCLRRHLGELRSRGEHRRLGPLVRWARGRASQAALDVLPGLPGPWVTEWLPSLSRAQLLSPCRFANALMAVQCDTGCTQPAGL